MNKINLKSDDFEEDIALATCFSIYFVPQGMMN